jgi:F-type H+-transporting ATPase subunit delta
MANRVAKTYARAAFEVARQDNAIEDWLRALHIIAAFFNEPMVLGYLHSPRASGNEKMQLLEKTLEAQNVGKPMINFAKLILSENMMHMINEILLEFRELADKELHITRVEASTATELSEQDKQHIVKELEERVGGRVIVEFKVNPSLLGGMVLRVGDHVIDGSLRTRLEQLKQALAS